MTSLQKKSKFFFVDKDVSWDMHNKLAKIHR